MRISIWQQFSSNHSARFTIVGQFKHVEQADKAADELQHILKTIADWNESHPELEEQWSDGDLPEPTEPEKKFSQQYGVDWGETAIPWFWQAKVIALDNLVFVDSGGQADSGAYPLNEVMAKLDADVFVEGDIIWRDGYEVEVEITTTAPNEAMAQQIEREVEAYFAPQQGDVWVSARAFAKFAPWELYGTNYRLPGIADVLLIFRRDGADPPVEAARNVMRSLFTLLGTEPVNDAYVQAFVDSIQALKEHDFEVILNREKLIQQLDEVIRLAQIFSRYNAGGFILRKGQTLQLFQVSFGNIAYGLPALTHYLT